MGFYFSKSKFVSAFTRCDKWAWLDKNKPEEKAPIDEFAQSLFDNGHKVGALAQEYLAADVDVTSFKSDGSLDLQEMLKKTDMHLKLGTKAIAEASFSHNGYFCSVDVLVKNDDHTYNIYEVKSSTPQKPTKKNPDGVKERYILDAAYQRYVLESCFLKINKVYIVMLDKNYVCGKKFQLDKYFIKVDVTDKTEKIRGEIVDALFKIGNVLAEENEPSACFGSGCNGCEFWQYCSRNIASPSVFDVYGLNFSEKCKLYNAGVSFFDVPKVKDNILVAAKRQVEYYNRPNDVYLDKKEIKDFLSGITYPLYSLDFETYRAVVPEFEGAKTLEQMPFQYSLQIIDKPDFRDVKTRGFLDISGRDTRRAIAESLTENIPYGAQIIAYHESTERNIIDGLAKYCPDLADHLLSFTYKDPLKVFENGWYYTKAMGKSFSLKSVAPALYPTDRDMDYHNLQGDVKNGTQAMNVFFKAKNYTQSEKEKIQTDLEKYCDLDTIAVVKILQKLYEVVL